jgi:hypothetical protein
MSKSKNLVGVLLACALALVALKPVCAKSASDEDVAYKGVGFSLDILGGYYMPSASRYQGYGTGVEIGYELDNNITMGYRVENLSGSYSETAYGGTAGANTVAGNFNAISQGITAYYNVWSGEKISTAFGVWLGEMSSNNMPLGTSTTLSFTSPLLEPMGRVMYKTQGKVEGRAIIGLGYRFVRNLPQATFGNATGNGGAANTGYYQTLKNFDGLDLSFGVGLAF